jgi:predicted GNAT family acetyltransferase
MKLATYRNAGEFLAVAEAPLLRDEAKNNLILGIAGRVQEGRSYGQAPPIFLTVDVDGDLIAAAIRTPPYPLILHCEDASSEVIEIVVDHLLTADPHLPGVNGEARAVAAFAERWARRTRTRAEIERKMRIYVLHEVNPPDEVPGRMRPAQKDDIELLSEWIREFQEEAVPGDPPSDSREAVLRFMESGTLAVWDHDGPVSLAGSSRGSAHGAAVSAVYTPPEHRGHGYASACVAALSQHLLDRGNAFCTLYTDLSNPTSNRIYQRVGYCPVGDSATYTFAAPDPGTD